MSEYIHAHRRSGAAQRLAHIHPHAHARACTHMHAHARTCSQSTRAPCSSSSAQTSSCPPARARAHSTQPQPQAPLLTERPQAKQRMKPSRLPLPQRQACERGPLHCMRAYKTLLKCQAYQRGPALSNCARKQQYTSAPCPSDVHASAWHLPRTCHAPAMRLPCIRHAPEAATVKAMLPSSSAWAPCTSNMRHTCNGTAAGSHR